MSRCTGKMGLHACADTAESAALSKTTRPSRRTAAASRQRSGIFTVQTTVLYCYFGFGVLCLFLSSPASVLIMEGRCRCSGLASIREIIDGSEGREWEAGRGSTSCCRLSRWADWTGYNRRHDSHTLCLRVISRNITSLKKRQIVLRNAYVNDKQVIFFKL